MKRKTKNIISICLIIIMCGAMVGTMSLAKNNLSSSIDTTQNNMPGGNPPDMPSGESGGTPPDMPNNSSNNNNSNSNTNTSDSTNTPPEKPDGDTSSNDSSNNSQSMPNGNNGTTPPSGNMPGMNNNNQTTNSLTTPYYIAFGVEGFILSGCLIYLIMSGFNKKSFRETISSSDKLIIIILGTTILTAGFTYLDGEITKNYFLKNSNSSTNYSKYNNNAMPGGNGSSIEYSASKEIKESTTITSGSYSSSTKDENAILVTGDIDTTLSDVSINKTGDSDGGDNTSFYGTNSGILAKDGAVLNLKNITVTTNATGANGVFSYGGSATTTNAKGDGTTVNISDSKITTTKDNSGGIMTTGGGVMNAFNLTINTAGTSSAAIRSDRGGGTVTVNKGTYTTTGKGSPVIYSTADITVKNAALTSKTSEGVVIEGKNSVTLENVVLTDTNNKLNGQSTTYKNIFLYQSMSGDADTGTSAFSSKNSTITTNKGDTFYVTNTTATINLENNKIINNDSSGNFLRAQKDSWGNTGSNGGVVNLNMNNQNATGNIVIDSISTLTMNMKNSSYYEGTINSDNTAKSIKITLDKSSKIKLTGNSYVTSLDDEDTSYSNIDFNGYKLYVNGKAIN